MKTPCDVQGAEGSLCWFRPCYGRVVIIMMSTTATAATKGWDCTTDKRMCEPL